MSKTRTLEPLQMGTVVKWRNEEGYVTGAPRFRQQGPNHDARVVVEYPVVVQSTKTNKARSRWVSVETILKGKVVRPDRTDVAGVQERLNVLRRLGAPSSYKRNVPSVAPDKSKFRRALAEIGSSQLVSNS